MSMPYKRFVLPLLFILFSIQAYAQKLPAGPQVLTFFSDVDDTEQPYGLYLPKNYDENKKYPLVVMLHGAGSNHRLSLRRVFGKSNAPGETDVEATRYFPEWKDVGYIVASPLARGTMGYQGIAEQDVYDVLTDVKKRFNIDEDRTYLTGLSMGGGGTIWIGLTRPDIWAALFPVCPAPPKESEYLMGNALNIPMYFHHGDQDSAVPVAVSRDWTKRLKDLGVKVSYMEYPGVNHNSWVNAYKDEAVFEWFNKFTRNKFPDRVVYNTKNYKYSSAYWVKIDQLTPGTLATIDAKVTAPNTIEIKTTSLGGFTLQLKDHPKIKTGEPIELIINGEKKIKVQDTSGSYSLMLQNGKWVDGKIQVATASKKASAEGPISEAFANRHIYVYGTGGNPSDEEVKARIAIATHAANLSEYRGAFLGRLMIFPRVLSDKDVRPSDIVSSNLILFGTKETNSIIEKYSDRLPLQLNPTANDYGLFYVFPVDKHYVAIASGLPWWKGTEALDYRLMPASLTSITEGRDFILFKNSVSNIIAEGYFDLNWKLQPADTKKITDSGVVNIHK